MMPLQCSWWMARSAVGPAMAHDVTTAPAFMQPTEQIMALLNHD